MRWPVSCVFDWNSVDRTSLRFTQTGKQNTRSGCGVCQAGAGHYSGNQSASFIYCPAAFERCWLLDGIRTGPVGCSRVAISQCAWIWGLYLATIFGFHLAVLGYLIFKSGYFPRILGILMVLRSLGYLLDSYGNTLFPNYAEIFGVIVGVTAVIGELPFFLWLLIKGVNVERYNERAQQAR